MGLLPELAADLLPASYASSPTEANAQAGWLITAYALGVVLGSPLVALISTRLPRRRALLGLLAVFTLGTIATAFAPNFGLAIAGRVIAALPHGAYFGLASIVAASLVGPERRGRGIAFILSGLAFANLIGVPALTWIGQAAGWRAAFLTIAAVFALAWAAVSLLVHLQPTAPRSSTHNEFEAFRHPQLWLVLVMGAIGFGGFFAVLAYVAPMVTSLAGVDASFVPGVMVIAGLGMVLGNALAGRLADRGIKRSMYFFFGLMLASLAAMLLLSSTPIGFVVTLFFLAAAGMGLGPIIQMRLMDVAGKGEALAASLNHSALNLSNAIGAALGGLVIAAGLGYLSPIAVAIALTLVGLTLAVVSFRTERRAV